MRLAQIIGCRLRWKDYGSHIPWMAPRSFPQARSLGWPRAWSRVPLQHLSPGSEMLQRRRGAKLLGKARMQCSTAVLWMWASVEDISFYLLWSGSWKWQLTLFSTLLWFICLSGRTINREQVSLSKIKTPNQNMIVVIPYLKSILYRYTKVVSSNLADHFSVFV